MTHYVIDLSTTCTPVNFPTYGFLTGVVVDLFTFCFIAFCSIFIVLSNPKGERMRSIAIEGIDGSGKTTVAEALKDELRGQGLCVGVVSPYRLASKEYGGDLYPLWQNEIGAKRAIGVLKNVLELTEVCAEKAGLDVLIYDRHWMTAFTEIADRPALVSEWGATFVPTALLRANPTLAQQRARNDCHEAWMSPEGLRGYAEKYEQLCSKYGQHLLGVYRNDTDVTPGSIARNIAWDMNITR